MTGEANGLREALRQAIDLIEDEEDHVLWFNGSQPPGDRDFGCSCDHGVPLGHTPEDNYDEVHREHLTTVCLPLFERVQTEARRDALTEAADQIQGHYFHANMPQHIREQTVRWLRDRATTPELNSGVTSDS